MDIAVKKVHIDNTIVQKWLYAFKLNKANTLIIFTAVGLVGHN